MNMVSFENWGICMGRHAASDQRSFLVRERWTWTWTCRYYNKQTKADGFWFFGCGKIRKVAKPAWEEEDCLIKTRQGGNSKEHCPGKVTSILRWGEVCLAGFPQWLSLPGFVRLISSFHESSILCLQLQVFEILVLRYWYGVGVYFVGVG